MGKKDIQFNLRIPEELKNKVDAAAKANQRSINAEATSRLYDSFVMNDNIQVEAAKIVEKFLRSRSPTERKKVVAERLNFVLSELKKIHHFREFTIAELAFEIDEDTADEAEAWFRAELEPTFGQLEKIAQHTSANPNWLLFGKQTPYDIQHIRLNEYLDQDIKLLVGSNPNNEYLNNSKVKEIKFIRELSETGQLIILKIYENYAVETFYPPYHISDVTGVGGYNSLLYFCLLTKVLLRYYKSKVNVYSHLLSEEQFKLILTGTVHPLTIAEKLHHIPWVDDLADRLPNKNLDYWDGFDTLRARILRDFAAKEYIQEIWNDPELYLKHPIEF
ncbi:Arc family DNA-binding protein [Acinetobacter ursingii]|uniref:Arc family DNA-binding protein n=1 Tax=Acinetobacter ursingii TaxID=108980 RepID=UPI003AF949B0